MNYRPVQANWDELQATGDGDDLQAAGDIS